MTAVIQRVSRASVSVGEERIADIGKGLLVLLGVGKDDDEKMADKLAEKIVNLRIMPDRSSGGKDEKGKMNKSVLEVGGEVLVVSQFTLLGDTSRGRRPSFVKAAEPEKAARLYESFVEAVKKRGVETKEGRFGEYMEVELVNDGPVTLVLSD